MFPWGILNKHVSLGNTIQWKLSKGTVGLVKTDVSFGEHYTVETVQGDCRVRQMFGLPIVTLKLKCSTCVTYEKWPLEGTYSY